MIGKTVQELEEQVWDKLEEYFPKGKHKDRGKAMVLIALAKEMGVKGHIEHLKKKQDANCVEDEQ